MFVLIVKIEKHAIPSRPFRTNKFRRYRELWIVRLRTIVPVNEHDASCMVNSFVIHLCHTPSNTHQYCAPS